MAALEAAAVERAAFDAFKEQAKATLEREKLQMLQRSWALASHAAVAGGGGVGRHSVGALPHARSEPASPPPLQSSSAEPHRSSSYAMLDPACATGAGAPPPRLGASPLPQRDSSSSLPREFLPPLAAHYVTACRSPPAMSRRSC